MRVSSLALTALVLGSQDGIQAFSFIGGSSKQLTGDKKFQPRLTMVAGYLDNLSNQPPEEPKRFQEQRSYAPWFVWGTKQSQQSDNQVDDGQNLVNNFVNENPEIIQNEVSIAQEAESNPYGPYSVNKYVAERSEQRAQQDRLQAPNDYFINKSTQHGSRPVHMNRFVDAGSARPSDELGSDQPSNVEKAQNQPVSEVSVSSPPSISNDSREQFYRESVQNLENLNDNQSSGSVASAYMGQVLEQPYAAAQQAVNPSSGVANKNVEEGDFANAFVPYHSNWPWDEPFEVPLPPPGLFQMPSPPAEAPVDPPVDERMQTQMASESSAQETQQNMAARIAAAEEEIRKALASEASAQHTGNYLDTITPAGTYNRATTPWAPKPLENSSNNPSLSQPLPKAENEPLVSNVMAYSSETETSPITDGIDFSHLPDWVQKGLPGGSVPPNPSPSAESSVEGNASASLTPSNTDTPSVSEKSNDEEKFTESKTASIKSISDQAMVDSVLKTIKEKDTSLDRTILSNVLKKMDKPTSPRSFSLTSRFDSVALPTPTINTDPDDHEFLSSVLKKIESLQQKLSAATNRMYELETETATITAAASALSSELEDKSKFEIELKSYADDLEKEWEETRALNTKLERSLARVTAERDKLVIQLRTERDKAEEESSEAFVAAAKRINDLETALSRATKVEEQMKHNLLIKTKALALKSEELQVVTKELQMVQSSEASAIERLVSMRNELTEVKKENQHLAKELADTVLMLESTSRELERTSHDLSIVNAAERVMNEKVSNLEQELALEIKKGFKLSRELANAKDGLFVESVPLPSAGMQAQQVSQPMPEAPIVATQATTETLKEGLGLSPFEKSRMAFLGKTTPVNKPIIPVTATQEEPLYPPIAAATPLSISQNFEAKLREAQYSSRHLRDVMYEAVNQMKEMETMIGRLKANESILEDKMTSLSTELQQYSKDLETKTIEMDALLANEESMKKTIAAGQKKEVEMGRKLEFFKTKLSEEIVKKEELEAEVSRLTEKYVDAGKLALGVPPSEMENLSSTLPEGTGRVVFALLNVALIGWLLSQSAIEGGTLLWPQTI